MFHSSVESFGLTVSSLLKNGHHLNSCQREVLELFKLAVLYYIYSPWHRSQVAISPAGHSYAASQLGSRNCFMSSSPSLFPSPPPASPPSWRLCLRHPRKNRSSPSGAPSSSHGRNNPMHLSWTLPSCLYGGNNAPWPIKSQFFFHLCLWNFKNFNLPWSDSLSCFKISRLLDRSISIKIHFSIYHLQTKKENSSFTARPLFYSPSQRNLKQLPLHFLASHFPSILFSSASTPITCPRLLSSRSRVISFLSLSYLTSQQHSTVVTTLSSLKYLPFFWLSGYSQGHVTKAVLDPLHSSSH